MNRWMKSIYSGYREIGVIGNVLSKWSARDILPAVDAGNITYLNQSDNVSGFIRFRPVDLILIDLDAFGLEQTRFFIFLSRCFAPQTPLVLITETDLPDTTRRSLHVGQVLGIIVLNSSTSVPAMSVK